MTVRNADGPVATVAAVVGEDERDDSGEVALKRQHEQVAQEPQMLLIVGRDSERPRILCHAQVDRGPTAFDALLELTNAVQVFIELAPVGGAECLTELSGVLGDEVEDALVVSNSLWPVLRRRHDPPGCRRADRRPGGD